MESQKPKRKEGRKERRKERKREKGNKGARKKKVLKKTGIIVSKYTGPR